MGERPLERVVITGLGAVAGGAADARSFAARFFADVAAPTAPGESRLLAPPPVDAARLPRSIRLRGLDATSLYAVAAGSEAAQSAGLSLDDLLEHPDVGLALGTCSGPLKWVLEQCAADRSMDYANPRVPARAAVNGYFGSPIGTVTIPLKLTGPSMLFCNLDVAATDAIGYAFELVRHARARMMLAGGADSAANPLVLADMERAGYIGAGSALGDGAAMLVLEAHSSAVARGARILAELVGYDTAMGGSVAMFRRLLKRAATAAGDVDAVVATQPPSSTLERDERTALAALSDGGPSPDTRTITRSCGHTLGAAGALQAAAATVMVSATEWTERRQRMPATVLQSSVSLSGKVSALLFKRAA